MTEEVQDSQASNPIHGLVRACGELLNKVCSDARTPSTLYHLTDVQGAMGIAHSKTLWSSLATALNDASEVSYGMGIAIDVATTRFQAQQTEYSRALVDYLMGHRQAPSPNGWSQYPFVVSFCEGCDRSGQWLHYGRSGKGVALGFHPGIAKVMGAELIAVDYDQISQRDKFDKLFTCAEQSVATTDVAVAAHLTTIYATLLAGWMKHPSFSDEREWRLWGVVQFQGGTLRSKEANLNKITSRFSDGRLVPYEAFPFEKRLDVLQEVVLGYSSPVSLDAMKLMLLKSGFTCEVRRSEVPVR